MQIGTPGSAYGQAGVMSRPTLGRAITPLPGAIRPQPIQAALGQARRMPRAVGSKLGASASVLQQELARRMALSRHVQATQGVVASPEVGGYPSALAPVQATTEPQNDPWIAMTGPTAAVGTDPAVLLARARLAQMMGS